MIWKNKKRPRKHAGPFPYSGQPLSEREVVETIFSGHIINRRSGSLLRHRPISDLRSGRGCGSLDLVHRRYAPNAYIIVPSAIEFPGPEIEGDLHLISDLVLVQLSDLIVPE